MDDPVGVDSRDLAGVPDGFDRLWTPHRMAYISGESRPKDSSQDECPFCTAPHQSDEEGLIVHRGNSCFVLMNLFPYNAGHLLVCPYRHIPDYTALTSDERIEFGELTATAMEVERESAHPQGFNIGMNQGEVAGAGIAGHLHQHVVPRWRGDSNFLPIIARTRALSELLEDARSRLAAQWILHAQAGSPC